MSAKQLANVSKILTFHSSFKVCTFIRSSTVARNCTCETNLISHKELAAKMDRTTYGMTTAPSSDTVRATAWGPSNIGTNIPLSICAALGRAIYSSKKKQDDIVNTRPAMN